MFGKNLVEDAPVTWAEIELKGKRCGELILHAEEAVEAAFGIVPA